MNQQSPKDPESVIILTMKLLYTYFWKTLPDLAHLSPNHATHLKSPKK